MAKLWINHYIDESLWWSFGEPSFRESGRAIDFKGGANVRIHETDVGGTVFLAPEKRRFLSDLPISTNGIAEVYLKISFADGSSKLLSAPLHTTIELERVSRLELRILYLIGCDAFELIRCRALLNAHCVYEVIP